MRNLVAAWRRVLSPPVDRPQSAHEELANSLSHGLAFLLALAAVPLQVQAAQRGGASLDLLGTALFCATLLLLYLSSTLYHAVPADGRWKARFNRLDHAAIYLFIAGSYTPFALGALRQGNELWFCVLFWTLALLGAGAKLMNRLSHPMLSTALYLAMGWLAVAGAGPLFSRIEPLGATLLVAGGLAYTVGAVVFQLDSRWRFAHLLWHLLVIAGSTCHFLAALWYAH